MTKYLFKLARRMASAFAPAGVVLLAACSEAAPRDFLGPDPSNPPPASGPVSLQIAPKTGAIAANQPLQFRAWGRTASGDSIPVAASWTASGGQIGPDGVFRSAAGGSFTVQAFAVGKPHLTDAATVQVEAPLSIFAGLQVGPTPAAVPMGGTLTFYASAPLATGGMTVPSVTWTASGGTITPNGTYSAGMAPGSYQVVAATVDGAWSDTVTVQVQAASLQVLAVSPKALTVSSGELVDFAVTGQWNDGSTSPPAVEWSATTGSIGASGRLAVGGTPGLFQVVARHAPSGRADTALVTVMPAVARIEVTPGSSQLQPGAQKSFSAMAVRTDGVVLPVAVTWSATGGTISASGVYSAGSTVGSFRVIARYLGGVFADTAEVAIAAPAATLTGLTLTPGTATAGSGALVHFNVVPAWSDGSSALPPLVWTATGGLVSGDGTWTAPVEAGSYQVVVRHPGSGLADTATVTVTEAPRVTAVTISDQVSSIQTGGTRQFSAEATWSDGASRPVEWLWTATGGTITVNGLYTAGSLAGQFLVIASCAGCSAADTTNVSVTAAPPPAATLATLVLSPAQALLNPGDVLPLHLSASWSDGSTQVPDLAWTVEGGTRSGLHYTAGTTPGTFQLIARHAAGTRADTSVITIQAAGGTSATLTSLVLNPSSVSMNAGEQRALTLAATWSDGSTTVPPVIWDATGGTLNGLTYTAGSTAGSYRVIVRHQGGTRADTTTVTVVAADPLVSLTVSPDSTSVPSGFSVSFTASGKTASGATVAPQVTWSATGGTITAAGVYTASTAAGTFRVVATCATCTLADTAVVVIGSPTPPPPTGSIGDLVVFPNDEIAFIIGPQLKAGAASNPWPWYDQNMAAKGLEHGTAFPISPSAEPVNSDHYINRNYYDLGLNLYTLYYRTGNTQHLSNARKVADSWWQINAIGSGTTSIPNSFAPRNISLGGLMLRAMDGRPEMWPWITEFVRYQFNSWVGLRLNNVNVYYGVRDGGYMLTFAAWLAAVHPDPAVRAEFKAKALEAATTYFARLQYPDGGWYWDIDGQGKASQPFQVGLLLEGMVAVHKLTSDAIVGQSITKAAEWLYVKSFETQATTNLPDVRWRAMRYFTRLDDHTSNNRTSALRYNQAAGAIRDERQLNGTTVHVFGYAFKITSDPKFIQWGDDIFSATFGKGNGPGADPYWGLADFREKEYSQSYRSSGRYLAWRVGF